MNQLESIKQSLQQLKAEEPKLRNRDLAKRLNISEAELLSLSAGEDVIILNGDWKSLIVSMKDMGYVMALTRNEHCVHERKGIYDNVKFYDGPHNMGVAVNPDIDLRFLMNEWTFALAVTMQRGDTNLYSFQFFNASGEAVHKIFSTPKSDISIYHKLVEEYKADIQKPLKIGIRPTEKKDVELPDEAIDVSGFQNAWKTMKDTHQFFGILKKFKVKRTQALRLAPDGFAEKVDNETVVKVLNLAADQKVSIMCFLHSKGCIQIHTGPVKNLKTFGDWYNVMDPKFNLHLKMNAIAETWIVKKPTSDGLVTSLELFDDNGELITYFFGARKPGKPELESWRSIIQEITPQNTVC